VPKKKADTGSLELPQCSEKETDQSGCGGNRASDGHYVLNKNIIHALRAGWRRPAREKRDNDRKQAIPSKLILQRRHQAHRTHICNCSKFFSIGNTSRCFRKFLRSNVQQNAPGRDVILSFCFPQFNWSLPVAHVIALKNSCSFDSEKFAWKSVPRN
jgi:hypothetical protein